MSERHAILGFIDGRGGLENMPDYELTSCLNKLMEEHRNDRPSVEQRVARAEALAIINGEILRRFMNA